MFTGIVQAVAEVSDLAVEREGLRFRIDRGAWSDGLALGASVAIDGCCLTVEHLDAGRAGFFAGRETLERSTLRSLADGARVHVERSLRLGDELGGHLVSGHVDGRARVLEVRTEPSQTVLTVTLGAELARQLVPKGSVALAGVSLTISALEGETFSVSLIPHTLGATRLGTLAPGDELNVEIDAMSKWLARRVDVLVEERLGRAGLRPRTEGDPR